MFCSGDIFLFLIGYFLFLKRFKQKNIAATEQMYTPIIT